MFGSTRPCLVYEYFDIGGNKYRLVAAIHYRGKRVYVGFIGSRKEYGKIDAESV
jgi:mRNA interferase HigB